MTTLEYLSRELGAAVPEFVRERARVEAVRDVHGRGAALYGVWSQTRRDLDTIKWMIGGWRPRWQVLRWMFLPTPEYLRMAYGRVSRWLLPFCYVYRPAYHLCWLVARAMRHRLGGVRNTEGKKAGRIGMATVSQ